MKQLEKVNAILSIRPNAEFIICDGEIEWLDEKQTQPTQQEIEAAFISYQEKLEAEKLAIAEKKAAALAKLEALGLEIEDLKALGLG